MRPGGLTAGAALTCARVRAVTMLAVIAAVLTCAAACGGSSPASGTPGGTPAHSDAHTPTAATPAATRTGAQFAQMLAADIPSGWKALGGSAFSSGTQLDAAPQVPLPQFDRCSWIGGAPGLDTQMNPWQVSYASVGLVKPPGSGTPQQSADLGFAGFRPGDAVKGLDWETALVHRCHTFTEHGEHVRLTSMTLPGLGDQNLYFTDENRIVVAGQPSVSSIAILIVRVGNNLVGVDSDTFDGMISMAAMKTLAEKLIGQLGTG
jgi:hypothetical protein